MSQAPEKPLARTEEDEGSTRTLQSRILQKKGKEKETRTRHPFSVSQTIPPEMLSRILFHIRPDGKPWSEEYKEGLASINLTCRHWERHSRRYLFRSLTLNGPEDVQDLVDMLIWHPSSYRDIARMIRNIWYYNTDGDVLPWARLHSIMRKASIAELRVGVEGVESDKIDGNTLVHAYPKTLPPSALPRIARLDLESVHFHHVNDFVQFTGPIQGSHISLNCKSLTFNAELKSNLRPRNRA